MLQRLQLLGAGDPAGGQPLLVAGSAQPNLFHVRLGLGQLPLQVGLLGLGGDDLVAQPNQLGIEALDLGVLGQGPAPVLELVDV